MSHSTAAWSQYCTCKKLRLYLAWPAALAALWLARECGIVMARGVPLVAAGVALRWWAAGSVRKGRALATGGVYAHLRNPLYVGSLLILLGFCAMLNHPVIWLVLPAGFLLLYGGTVRREEADLRQKFGENYRRYCRAVPRWLPRWRPYRDGSATTFSWRYAYANGESITSWSVLLAVLGAYFYQIGVLTPQPSQERQWFWLLIAAAVGAELTLEVLERRRKDRPDHRSVGELLYRRRAWLPVPLLAGGLVLLLVVGNPRPWGTWPRLVIDLAGLACLATAEGLRMWGVGHCGRKTRSADIHAGQLVMSGPYAHVRHPLYVSNLLVTLGIAWLTGWWLAALACLLYWVIVYRRILGAEEAFLHVKFGPVFETYRRRVPQVLPRLTPAVLPPSSTFRAAELRKEYQTVLAIAAAIVCVEAALAAHGWLPKVARVWLHRWHDSQPAAWLDRRGEMGYRETRRGVHGHA